MHTKKTCALVRHPTAREGQTAFARDLLKSLKIVYAGNIYVIDTVAYTNIHNKYAFYIQELAKLLSNLQCSVIHSLNVNKPLTSIAGLIGVKDIVAYKFSYLPEVHGFWEYKRTLIEHGSKLVIGTSKRIANLFNNGIFIYPPIDTDLFKPRNKALARKIIGLPLNKVIVGYVGDIDEDRGFDVVVNLATTLGNENVKFLVSYLHIDNIKRETINYFKEALEKNTLIVKKLLPVWYVYNAVDILLLPIYKTYSTEPPATLIEALGSGTPIIGGSSLSMQDYEGLYIRVKNIDEYGDEVTNMITDKDFLNVLSLKCRRFAVNNLSYSSVARRLEQVFKHKKIID
jgi:glycosyltransferase involved in cell wall biosynthesis